MEKIKKARKNSRTMLWVKAASAALTGIVFMTATLSVYAATLKSADGYEYLYHLTDYGVEEEWVPFVSNYNEYIEYGNGEGIVIKAGRTYGLSHICSSFEGTVESGELVETVPFTCEEGNTVLMNIEIIPYDVTVKMGIILPDGSKKYVQSGNKHNIYEFFAASSGEYKAFIENNSGICVSVAGGHIFSSDVWMSLQHISPENGEEGSHIYWICCMGCSELQAITIPCNHDQIGYHSTPY